MDAEPTVFRIQRKITDRVTHEMGIVDVPGDDILALVDAGGESYKPKESLFKVFNLRILSTSPPRRRGDRKWLDQWCPYLGQTLMALDANANLGMLVIGTHAGPIRAQHVASSGRCLK
jgi:hypothetical protein